VGGWNAKQRQAFFFAEKPMRLPRHLLRISTIQAEPLMAAMAAIAIGMAVGTWVIGPAMTHAPAEATAATTQEHATFEDMVARPDPLPYRAATPAFDTSGPPNYAEAAKQKAKGELSGRTADAEERAAEPQRSWSRSYYRPFDRHRVY
jgi:hypothetical protein